MWQSRSFAGLLVLATLAACSQCTSSPGAPDAMADAGSDVDARPKDVAQDGPFEGCAPDGGQVFDWPGWRRLTEWDPCCVVDTAIDPLAVVPDYTWTKCDLPFANCEQLDWPKYEANGGGALADQRGSSNGGLIFLNRWISAKLDYWEVTVHERVSGKVKAAWRLLGTGKGCSVAPFFAETTVTLYGRSGTNGSSLRWFAANGSLAAVSSAPSFTKVYESVGSGVQEFAVSDTTIVLGVQPGSSFVRGKPNSSVTVETKGTPLINAHVHADDVYGRDQQGNAGWSQYWRVNIDATLTLFRAKPQTHITALTSDSGNLYWAESWGGNNIDPNVQPHVEIWTAPYTNDPSTLSSTATKLATLDGIRRPGELVVQNGVVGLTENGGVVLVRKQDGAIKSMPRTQGESMGLPVYVSSSEIWLPVHLPADPATVLMKVGLGMW